MTASCSHAFADWIEEQNGSIRCVGCGMGIRIGRIERMIQAARAEALEEAAKQCEKDADGWTSGQYDNTAGALRVEADTIRALASKDGGG